MPKLDVRQVNVDDDLEALGTAFGDHEYFVDRFGKQTAHKGVLFGARLNGQPVGHVYLWLQKAEEKAIRRRLPKVPLLTHLEVHPEYRDRGIGTQLITAVEERVHDLRHDRVALAVRTDNIAAQRLYERLGYQEWDYGLVECFAVRTLPNGTVEREPEKCRVLVKNVLAAGPTAPSVVESEVMTAVR
jgi:GNAT superfamily N-acetyltransferase